MNHHRAPTLENTMHLGEVCAHDARVFEVLEYIAGKYSTHIFIGQRDRGSARPMESRLRSILPRENQHLFADIQRVNSLKVRGQLPSHSPGPTSDFEA